MFALVFWYGNFFSASRSETMPSMEGWRPTDIPTREELARDLANVLTVGVGRPIRRGVQIKALESVATMLSADASLPPLRQVEDALRASLERLGDGKFAKATRLAFGAAKETKDLRTLDARRREAADELGVGHDRLKQTYQDAMCEALADDLLRRLLNRPASAEPPIDTEGAQADTEASSDDAAMAAGMSNPRRIRSSVAIAIFAAIALAVTLAVTQLESPPRVALPSYSTLNAQARRGLSLSQTPVPGTASPLLGYGDAEGGRPIFPYADTTPTSATPVFDSIVDAPEGIGDERLFLRVAARSASIDKHHTRLAAARVVLDAPRQDLIWLWFLIDNNAGEEPNCHQLTGPTIAQNTRARLAVWNSDGDRLHVIRAWLDADNASPKWITSAVAVITAEPTLLRLQPKTSWEYAILPSFYNSMPPLPNRSLLRPAGMSIGPGGLVGSCWSNRFVLYVAFRQIRET